jgi:ABC-type uncharacterized transport system substrate-binding protein
MSSLMSAFNSLTRGRYDGLTVLQNPVMSSQRAAIIRTVEANRLPAIYGYREFVAGGGLVSYGPDVAFLYRRAVAYVDKILKGAKPADLPVEQPTRFELVINLKTAKALGLTIPQSVLLRADQIIE